MKHFAFPSSYLPMGGTSSAIPKDAAASRARFRRVVLGLLGAFASVACSRTALAPGATQMGDAQGASGAVGTDGAAGASGGGNGAAGATTTGPSDRFGAAWARSVASVRTSAEFNSVAADRSGNVYVAGDMWGPGSLDFGNGATPTVASNGWDALLIKYDQSGRAQWAQVATATWSTSTFSSAVVDSTGNIYVSGCIDDSQDPKGAPDSVDFGNGVSVAKSDASQNALLVKYASSGLAQWARVVTGSPGSCFGAATLDTAGNVYVVGGVAGTGIYTFGNGITVTGVATASNQFDAAETAILAKYDSSGAVQWVHSVEAGSPTSGFSFLAVDAKGNVYVAGDVAGTGTYDFGNGVTVAGTTGPGDPGGQLGGNALLVKYSSSGIAQWARTPTAGPTSGSGFQSVAVDSAGGIYAVGMMGGGTYDFGNAVTVAGSVKNGSFTGTVGPGYLVLAKFDNSGTAQWARTVNPGGSNSYLTSVAVDSSDSVYVVGAVDSTGTYDFGSGVTIATGSHGTGYYAAVVKYDPSGVAQWSRSCTNGNSTEDIFNSIALDFEGNLYAAGVIGEAGVVDFGNNVTLTTEQNATAGGWNPLLVKYH